MTKWEAHQHFRLGRDALAKLVECPEQKSLVKGTTLLARVRIFGWHEVVGKNS